MVVNCLMTIVAMILVDRKGRKFLLKIGTAGIVVGLLGTGFLFNNVEKARKDVTTDVAALLAAQNGKSDMVMAGVTVTDVNQMMKKFNETKKMVKQATAGMEQQASRKGKKGKKGKRRRGLGIPGMGGMSMSDLKKIQDMMGQ